ncbi:MAG: hypothetical protein JO016_09375 [Actinobacteria bacterium]|nr:hypothetical protein [Actinomycetota bacterium]
MRQLPGTGEPVWDLQFDENGQLTSPARGDFLSELAGQVAGATGLTDLFFFSHGWGTAEDKALDLYNAMFPMIRAAAHGLNGLGSIGFAGIYWPSLWFPPTPATPPGNGGSQQSGEGAVVGLSTGVSTVSGAAIAASLAPGFADPGQQQTITQIGKLIDDSLTPAAAAEPDASKQQRLGQIAGLIKSLTPPAPADGEYEDSGETALLLTDDPVGDYQAAADAFGSAVAPGAEQSIGDWFSKAVDGAKDVLRVFSYTTMKARAGTIGRNGLGPLLAALHTQSPAVRVHLIGHSFGARLVSFALAGVGAPAASPVASLTLLEGAFSHWSFSHAQDNPFGSPGALNTYADRVHGPLVATYTVYDWAVGVWYPKASFLAQQDNQATVTADRWGGLGADGFQAVSPEQPLTMPAQGGTGYGFAAGRFYRIDCAAVINNTAGEPFSGAHSDIQKVPVAQLAAAAAAAHA